MKTVQKDYRPAFVFDNVKDLKLEKINIQEADHNKQVILGNTEVDLNDIRSEIIKHIE